MQTELHCQNCETLVPTPESSAGESVTCPGCGARIFVPTTDAEDTIPLKLPSGINLDHRPGVFGDPEDTSDSSSPKRTPGDSTSQDGDHLEGIPRLAVVGSDDDSSTAIPVATSSSDSQSEPRRRDKPDNSTMVPRLPVLEKPASPDSDSSSDDDSDGAIKLRQPDEPGVEVGISDSLLDMMTSHENRVWRQERDRQQAEEAEQKAIFRFGVLCYGLAMLVTITAGLPYVLAASNRTSEGSNLPVELKDRAVGTSEEATTETSATDLETPAESNSE